MKVRVLPLEAIEANTYRIEILLGKTVIPCSEPGIIDILNGTEQDIKDLKKKGFKIEKVEE